MAQATAAARSITREAYETGLATLRTSVKANALNFRWLQLIDWDMAEQSWSLFEQLREAIGCDKEGLRLWTPYFVTNAIGFQLETRLFLLHLLLISFTKVESARGRRSGSTNKKKVQIAKPVVKKPIIRRTSDVFFFDADEEEKRFVRVLWNVRKYFHVDISESDVRGLTTIFHERLSTVSNWNDDEQVTSFIDSIRPANKPASTPRRKAATNSKPRGKAIVKNEPSCSSDSEQDHSYLSSEELSAQEIAAFIEEPSEFMAIDKCENQAESNFSNDPAVQAFAQAFMVSAPRSYSYEEVVRRCIETADYLFINAPDRVQGLMDCLNGFFNPASTSIEVPVGNFAYAAY